MSSYLTFSPLLARGERLFSVTFNPKVAPGFPLGSVMLYVARTFLSIFPAEARKHERQTTILLDIDANLLLFSECHAFWRGIFFVRYHDYFIYGDF